MQMKRFCYFQPSEGNDYRIMYSGWWMPRSILGAFKNTMVVYKTIWMCLRLAMFPPKPKPTVIILDTHPIAPFVLKILSRYKTIYVEHLSLLKDVECFTSHIKYTPSLLAVWGMKCADEILVQTECLANIFRRSHPQLQKDIKIFAPCVDVGVWNEECIDIHRILSDLHQDYILFSVFGRYRKRSNFRLVLSAFEHLLLSDLPDAQKNKIRLVFAGHTKAVDEKIYYVEIIEMTKEKPYAHQVTFLRQLPVVHKKTLIAKSAAVLHPVKYDVFPGPLLEAMHLGTAIIATNTGISANMLTHRVNAILVDPIPEKFAIAMYKIINRPQLAVFVREMAKSHFSSMYSFETFSRRLNTLVSKYHMHQEKTN